MTEELATEQPSWALPQTRVVPTWRLDAIRVAVEKINRKAARLGAAPFTLNVSAPRIVKTTGAAADGDERTQVEEVVDVTIAGEPIVVTGYRFLGRVDFEDGATIVNARPGETIPARYRSATTFCDHCASQRQRNAVFIFRRNGDEQHVQVGRSCLKDFLGHDPAVVLHSVSLWLELGEALDEDDARCGGRSGDLVLVDHVLAMAAAVVRASNGRFVSRTLERESDGRMASTAGDVAEQLFTPTPYPKGFIKVKVEDEDRTRAAEAKAWALESMAKAEQSDYEYNLTTLLQCEAVKQRRVGLLVSLIGVYARHLGELVARAKRVDAHVGQVGKRSEFDVTFAGASHYDSDFGTVFIGRFDTPQGLLVYKGTSPFWTTDLKAGDELRIAATIKEHAEYRGTKQTLIQRVRIVKRPELAAA